MSKPDIVAIDAVVRIPRWDERAMRYDAAHSWCQCMLGSCAGLLPAQHRELLKACGAKAPAKYKEIGELLHASRAALCNVFGIVIKGKPTDHVRYELRDVAQTLKLIRKVRRDEVTTENTQPTATEEPKKTTTKARKAGGFGGKKKTSTKKKANTKKKTSTKKKAGTKKKTGTKKKAAAKRAPADKNGVLGPVGGEKNWAKFDGMLGKRFRVNPDDDAVRGQARLRFAELVKKDYRNNVKLETLAEDLGRSTAYMLVNTKTLVPTK